MTETLIQAAIYDATNTKHAALWDNYKKTGDVVLRNEIVLLYSNLVEIIVKKMYYVFAGKEQIEDVISNGMLTLIKAVESFDPSRGIKFDTYASIRIKGSVIDYIRAQDWVPRTVREK
ncbi:MAG: polymerase sigma 28 subunit FliA/WhiG, partial [Oscillospiraceae bacterium]|nr:polymerase sigma 28 subunit FliA/WhiG [Oscillospiraceae bacterium]